VFKPNPAAVAYKPVRRNRAKSENRGRSIGAWLGPGTIGHSVRGAMAHACVGRQNCGSTSGFGIRLGNRTYKIDPSNIRLGTVIVA